MLNVNKKTKKESHTSLVPHENPKAGPQVQVPPLEKALLKGCFWPFCCDGYQLMQKWEPFPVFLVSSRWATCNCTPLPPPPPKMKNPDWIWPCSVLQLWWQYQARGFKNGAKVSPKHIKFISFLSVFLIDLTPVRLMVILRGFPICRSGLGSFSMGCSCVFFLILFFS